MNENLKLKERIYAQYANKPKFVSWMNITRNIGDEIASGANSVRKSLDIETASGESLRIIGRIVDVGSIKEELLFNAGEFADPDGTEFNDNDKTFSIWSTISNVQASDDLLRLAIRAKIMKNSANPTCDGILSALQFVFPNAGIFRLVNNHDMTFFVEHTGKFTTLESLLLENTDFLPTPQGVKLLKFISSFGAIEFLNFSEDSFGDEDLEFIL